MIMILLGTFYLWTALATNALQVSLPRAEIVITSPVLTDLPYKFTLAAVNTSLPNANSTGVPLVLGQNGATSGLTFHVTPTYSSFPYDDYPSLALISGSLRAYDPSGEESFTNATQPRDGAPLSWVTSRIYSQPAAAVFGAVRDSPADEFAKLTVFGTAELWSLCPYPGFRGQTNVVYNVSLEASSSGAAYDPRDCYGVEINIVPI